jgi:hypothetical protein
MLSPNIVKAWVQMQTNMCYYLERLSSSDLKSLPDSDFFNCIHTTKVWCYDSHLSKSTVYKDAYVEMA